MADLNTDIRFIKGVGETRARALEKLHIRTLGLSLIHISEPTRRRH